MSLSTVISACVSTLPHHTDYLPSSSLCPLLSLQAAQQNRDVAIIEEEGEEVAEEEEENQYEMNKEE